MERNHFQMLNIRLRNYYQRSKETLLSDPSICEPNRRLFADFFTFQEHKLKRINGIPELADGCHKTLVGYIRRMRNSTTPAKNDPQCQLKTAHECFPQKQNNF